MYSYVDRLARYTAIVGGILLSLLIFLTCVSVIGRGLNTFGHWELLPTGLSEALLATGVAPIDGDFELVEAGIAFAIFSFLPLAQLHRGHATVDIFTAQFPRSVQRLIWVFWEVILGCVILLITWRLGVGMIGKMNNGETTFLLQFPIWWAYAASFAAAVIASIVSLYCAVTDLFGLVTGREIRFMQEGAQH